MRFIKSDKRLPKEGKTFFIRHMDAFGGVLEQDIATLEDGGKNGPYWEGENNIHLPDEYLEWLDVSAPPLVKPLNWKTRKGGAFGVGGIFYRVYRSGIRECLEIVGSKVPIMCYHTLDEARSAAYAHHAQLVLSQLEI